MLVTDPPIDPAAYSNLDALGTVRTLGPWWSLLLAGLDPAVADMRPRPGAPTFGELASEQAVALAGALRRLGGSAGDAGGEPIEQLAVDVHEMAAGRLVQPEIRSALDDLIVSSLGLLRRAGRTLVAVGALGGSATGAVHGLFTSGGGVPKLPVPSIEVRSDGAAGDRQRTRRHHGRPWQALCLWSSDVVARLGAEGHPIEPGFAGENISISGLDWAAARPGVRLRIGAEVLVEVTVFALPCRQNARWFLHGEFQRMHHEREPGISRIYASVIHEGRIDAGDPVELVP